MRFLLFLVTLACYSHLRAQDIRDHWILSDSMHLQFTDSGLVFLGLVPFQSEESIATISDLHGNLLLFANESRVYDEYYNIIENGDSLFATINSTTSTQGAVLVPHSTIYVLFNRVFLSEPDGALQYSIIMYDSIVGNYYIPSALRKKVLQPTLFAEQIQVIRHGNGAAWWIIGRKLVNTVQKNSNAFVVYKLSGEDIILEHETVIGLEAHNWGELTASQDGSSLALASFSLGRLQLFDFDRCTGVVSNPRVLIDDSSSTYYGCAFSPDGSKLYVAKNNREVLEQVDLNSEPFSISTIFSANYGFNNSAGQLELGPDGKIYWIQRVQGGSFDSLPAMYLGVIQNPNAPGLACNYDPIGVWLGGRVNRSHGLPNHPNYYLGPLVGSPCDTVSNVDTTTAIQPIDIPPVKPCLDLRATHTSSSITLNIDAAYLNCTIEVYHSSGPLVYSEQANTIFKEINTTTWTPGVYVARLRTPDGNCPAQKFVVSPN